MSEDEAEAVMAGIWLASLKRLYDYGVILAQTFGIGSCPKSSYITRCGAKVHKARFRQFGRGREDEDDVPLRSRNRTGLSPFVGTTACCHGHSVFTVSIDSFNEKIILSSSDLLILWFCQVTQALLMYHAAVPHQVDAATDGYTP